ncbi:MAG: GTPase HflX [Clostridia bacterium]|nr:GTPase HflX [Clostridia bacterium]
MKEKLNQVHGNLEGIRDTVIEELAGLYETELEEDQYLSRELIRYLAGMSTRLRREIAVYITRDGEIVDVSVGTDRDVELRDYRLRRNSERLSCVRCVHTHPNGDGHLSDVDLSALRSFRYDAMTAIGCLEGEPTYVQTAFLLPKGEMQMDPPVRWYRVPDSAWLNQIEESDRLVGKESPEEKGEHERAVLIGRESEASLKELARLAETAGAEVVATFLQKLNRREKPDTALFIGRGRAEELSLQIQALEADVCIVDDELTGIQVRNLEDILRVKVIDRTGLILDIFAQRAGSSEGKLQVELAQLEYRSTRLIGQGLVLSRLAGGIGTRGPGESKLEMNRRRIRERMTELRRRLDEVERQRDVRRKNRERNEVPVAALVGYTNAGKSTLLNRLTGSDVYVQNQLFATLDTVSRRVEGEGVPFLLVDTVGFIRKLPHTLVKAFRSTLEEALSADVLVIVHDGESPDMLSQRETVEQVLQELGATSQGRVEVVNKCDLLPDISAIPGAIPVSAKTGEGLEEMLQAIRQKLRSGLVEASFLIPFSDYSSIGKIRESGRVLEESYTDTGTVLKMEMTEEDRNRLVRQLGEQILVAEA